MWQVYTRPTSASDFLNEPEAYNYNIVKTDFFKVNFSVLSIFEDFFLNRTQYI
jgi:hypothetical protein